MPVLRECVGGPFDGKILPGILDSWVATRYGGSYVADDYRKVERHADGSRVITVIPVYRWQPPSPVEA